MSKPEATLNLEQINFGFNGSNVRLLKHSYTDHQSENREKQRGGINVQGLKKRQETQKQETNRELETNEPLRISQTEKAEKETKEKSQEELKKGKTSVGHKETKKQKIRVILEKFQRIEAAFLKECQKMEKFCELEQENLALKKSLEAFEKEKSKKNQNERQTQTEAKTNEMEEARKLGEEVGKLKGELRKLQMEKEKWMQEIQVLQENESETERKLEETSKEKSQFRKELEIIQKENLTLKEINSSFKKEINFLLEEKKQVTSSLLGKEAELEVLRNQEALQGLEMLSQAQKTKELEENKNNLVRELENRTKQLREAKNSAESAKKLKEVEVETLNGHFEELKWKLVQMEEAMRSKEAENSLVLSQKDQEILKVRDDFRKVLSENKALHEQIQMKNEQSANEITLTQENLEKLVNELNSHQAKTDELILEKNTEIIALERQLKELESEKQRLIRAMSLETNMDCPSPFKGMEKTKSLEFGDGTETQEVFSKLIEQKETYEEMVNELLSQIDEFQKETIKRLGETKVKEAAAHVKKAAAEIGSILDLHCENEARTKQNSEKTFQIGHGDGLQLAELKKELNKKVNENSELFDLCQRLEQEAKENIVLKAILEGKQGMGTVSSLEDLETRLNSALTESSVYKGEIIALNKKIEAITSKNVFLEHQVESFKESLNATHNLMKPKPNETS